MLAYKALRSTHFLLFLFEYHSKLRLSKILSETCNISAASFISQLYSNSRLKNIFGQLHQEYRWPYSIGADMLWKSTTLTNIWHCFLTGNWIIRRIFKTMYMFTFYQFISSIKVLTLILGLEILDLSFELAYTLTSLFRAFSIYPSNKNKVHGSQNLIIIIAHCCSYFCGCEKWRCNAVTINCR